MSWPIQLWGAKVAGYGYSGSASAMSSIPTANGAHTKGNWVEVVASTPFAVNGILVNLSFVDQWVLYLVDVGVGGAGSEQVLISNLFAVANSTDNRGNRHYYFPVEIPAGTRISMRAQSSFAGIANIEGGIMLYAGGFAQSFQGVESCGPDTATSGPPEVDPGAAANVKGSWHVLTAATTYPCRALVLTSQNGTAYGNFGSGADWRIDVGIGGAGSEQVAIPDLVASVNLVIGRTYSFNWWVTPPLPFNVPVGTRITVRMCTWQTDAARRKSRLAAYLLY